MGLKAVPQPETNKPSPAAIRREKQREQLWPGSSSEVWNRKKEVGFCTVPRTLGVIMTLIEQLADKGKHVSRIYFELWCRAFDDYLIEVSDQEAFAFASGLVAAGRNVRSWEERIRVLEELGFVAIAPRGSKKYGYILLRDPHKVVKQLHAKGRVPANWWGAYTQRAGEIGYVLP
jgi:hypothetical protein